MRSVQPCSCIKFVKTISWSDLNQIYSIHGIKGFSLGNYQSFPCTLKQVNEFLYFFKERLYGSKRPGNNVIDLCSIVLFFLNFDIYKMIYVHQYYSSIKWVNPLIKLYWLLSILSASYYIYFKETKYMYHKVNMENMLYSYYYRHFLPVYIVFYSRRMQLGRILKLNMPGYKKNSPNHLKNQLTRNMTKFTLQNSIESEISRAV